NSVITRRRSTLPGAVFPPPRAGQGRRIYLSDPGAPSSAGARLVSSGCAAGELSLVSDFDQCAGR
ncbi:MAG: hypothetical protein ACXW50_25820, partial [Candidatus Binatia bacterium]